MKTYLRFWRKPVLQQLLLAELAWLRSEALALDTIVDETPDQMPAERVESA